MKNEQVLGYRCEHCRKAAFFLVDAFDRKVVRSSDAYVLPGKVHPAIRGSVGCQMCDKPQRSMNRKNIVHFTPDGEMELFDLRELNGK